MQLRMIHNYFHPTVKKCLPAVKETVLIIVPYNQGSRPAIEDGIAEETGQAYSQGSCYAVEGGM